MRSLAYWQRRFAEHRGNGEWFGYHPRPSRRSGPRSPRLDPKRSRAYQDEAARKPFFLYVDEFQTFTTLALANMLSELRKFGVGMVLAHQYLQQLDPAISHAVLGNAATLIAFRLGAYDAGLIAKEFEPVFAPATARMTRTIVTMRRGERFCR